MAQKVHVPALGMTRARAAAAVLGLSLAGPLLAQEADKADEVRVTGHYENAVGTSDAASQGNVGAKSLEARPLQRPADVLESVPGVITTQHSGEGKANQYFLRGFNLDHGTDFRTTVAHMPVNMPTHAHGQGYSDLNFLIPELISRISYKKGPYFAEDGDFASAGAADIHYYTKLRQGIATVGLGTGRWRRALAANSFDSGPGHLLYGMELFHNDGPWDNPSDYKKVNGVLSYSVGTNADGYTLNGMTYSGKWSATDQIPTRAVDSGAISRFGAVDPTDGGQTSRYSLSLDRHRSWSSGDFHMNTYFIKYRLKLFSNFTFFLKDPVNGDQFEQFDDRKVFGLDPTWTLTGKWGERQVINKFGADLRRDDIGKVALYNTLERERLSTVREDKVGQTGLGLFYESTVQWNEWVRTIAGLRTDYYRARVDSRLEANSGTSRDHVTSPKLNFVFGPFNHTEYFLNLGQGFHSNDARGTTITVDPATGDPAEKVKPLVKTRGEELGVRSELVPGLQSSLALWRLRLDSELVFVGDAGATEASRASLRRGIEWSNRYVPKPALIVDVDVSASRATFRDDDPAGNHIPGAIDKVASLGVTLNDIGRWSYSAHARYFGPRPLVEDNSVRSRSSTIVSLRTSYRLQRRLRLNLDVQNLFDRKVNDIDYFYASRLQTEAEPVSDVHFHPAEPRSVRIALIGEF
jgi:outer membrane receptor protein involved in Fe transport